MSSFPDIHMDADVEVSVTLAGNADHVLAEIARLKNTLPLRTATVRVKTKRAGKPAMIDDVRSLPQIRSGNADDAKESLAKLTHQTLVSESLARRVAEVIGACQVFTKGSVTPS